MSERGCHQDMVKLTLACVNPVSLSPQGSPQPPWLAFPALTCVASQKSCCIVRIYMRRQMIA